MSYGDYLSASLRSGSVAEEMYRELFLGSGVTIWVGGDSSERKTCVRPEIESRPPANQTFSELYWPTKEDIQILEKITWRVSRWGAPLASSL
ncbi:MAG: hypothetical protein HY695_19965 [Deltaproteobacteria bacterium]|nr:hypothetical protein [Deltaproteobacteria bacterium]